MSQSNAISVSAALSVAKKQLEDITVKVVGEVSEVSINARYKAVYFAVKDEHSSMPCMMWNNRYAACGVELRVGALIEITGRFTLYAAKGRMNFDVFSITLAGEGDLRMRVANLAKKLEAEGLMAASKKKPLPLYPQRIGLVTSPRGAAVYDVLRTLRRRYPLAEVVFAGVGVEGQKAPGWIIEGLHAVQDAGVDVMLLVRGGGSFEDLMPFNDEGLARTIAALDVPVVTGIGHEPDTSIADMVADVRASTPTAAAESVAPAMTEISVGLTAAGARLAHVMRSRLTGSQSQLARIASSSLFREPMRLIEDEAQRIDELAMRLATAIPGSMAASKENLAFMRHSLKVSLASLVPRSADSLQREKMLFISAGKGLSRPYREQLKLQAACLNAYSPLAVLSRGYSIAKDASGHVVKSVASVRKGDAVDVQVSDGVLMCKVAGKSEETYVVEEF